MRTWLKTFRGLEPELQLLVQVGLLLLALLLAHLLVSRVLARLRVRAAATENLWDDALVHALTGPVVTLLWVSGLLAALAMARRHLDLDWLDGLGQAWSLTLILALTWALLR